MKHLWILRHAKSSWKDANQADFDRPLTKSAITHIQQMIIDGYFEACQPEMVLCSGARRTRETAGHLPKHLTAKPLTIDNRIYEAPLSNLLEIMRAFKNALNTVLIIGHNPGVTAMASYCSGTQIDEIPTSGLIHIAWPSSSWDECVQFPGELLQFSYPKR